MGGQVLLQVPLQLQQCDTPYVTGDSVIQVIEPLKKLSDELFCWFANYQMKENSGKCNSDEVSMYVENYNIKSSKCKKLFDIKTDSKLSFDNHINEKGKNAGQKLNLMSRVTPYMDLPKRRMLLNTLFLSQFSYCPLIWMFYSRGKNNKINRLHGRCLQIIYTNKKSTFI